jgi:hypothetical protein
MNLILFWGEDAQQQVDTDNGDFHKNREQETPLTVQSSLETPSEERRPF